MGELNSRVMSESSLPSGNLPAQVTSFVGRRRELSQVKEELREHRLVTIVGPGGAGKTRLALETAYQLSRSYTGGCWLIDFGKHPARRAIVDHVASALELTRESGQWTARDLAARFGARRSLLIFDTCEHVIDEVADLAQALLRRSTSIDIIATSRQALGAAGENLVLLDGLEFPPPGQAFAPADLVIYESVALFLERGRSIDPGLVLNAQNAEAVSDIARRLEGYPLAIELAAARLRALAPAQIATRLKNQFQLLGASRVAEERHQTLRATIGWSYELCSRAEQLCWARLSTFPADFDLEAAEAVASGGDLGLDDILGLISALIDKSILRTANGGGDKSRYRLTDPIRDFGAEKLAEFEAGTSPRSRHLEYYSQLTAAVPELLFGPNQVEHVDVLRRELANLEAARLQAIAETENDTADSLVSAIALVSLASGALSEALEAVETATEHDGDRSTSRVTLLWLSAWIAINQGNFDFARQRASDCRRLAQLIGDQRGMINALQYLGQAELMAGDSTAAERHCRRAVTLARSSSEDHLLATSLVRHAQALDAQKDSQGARSALMESIAISERAGERWCRGFALWNLALIDEAEGKPAEGMSHAQEMLSAKTVFEDVVGMGRAVEIMAWCAADLHQPERSAVLLGAASEVWERTGAVLPTYLLARREVCLRRVVEALGESQAATLQRNGRSMNPAQAIAWSPREERPGAAATTSGGSVVGHARVSKAPLRSPLTPRENEVAHLVAAGMKNREIADRLVISPRTAEAHVEHILAKLGFTSRAQIRSWAAYQSASGD